MTARFNNLAILHSDAGDTGRAADEMAKCVAVELSLGQLSHPDTQREIASLLHLLPPKPALPTR